MPEHTVKLSMRPGLRDAGRADAWFVPGAGVDDWLPSLAGLPVRYSDLRFRVIADEQRQCLGAVVTGAGQSFRPGWLPYVQVSGKLFVPAKSRLVPQVTEEELAALLSGFSTVEYVWHPAAGLIGFEPDQILVTADLLSAPRLSGSEWDAALAGAYVNARLNSVTPADELLTDQIISGGQDDIGLDADNLGTAPRSPDESSSAGLKDFTAKALSPFARAAEWLTGQVGGAAPPAWVQNMRSWARQILHRASANQATRLNELKRLLSMLDSDPDRGLRYALPLGGDGTHRGVAPPSNSLLPHGVEYDAGDTGGGGPQDFWHVPNAIRAELIRRYHALAVRETELGRYRRAAYIYATLLHDYAAAAHVLAEGGLYRESAEIYRRKLLQPRRAAECLLQAGLWQDAVEIYAELKDWVVVAQTLEKLDESEGARAAWQKATEEYERGHDYIRAATVYEKKLNDSAAAAELLMRGWHNSSAGGDCLTELFELWGREEQHRSAIRLIDELTEDDDLAVNRQRDAAGILADVSRRYPDADVRAAAFDRARRIVARHLSSPRAVQRRKFLAVLEALNPDDRLLPRDCRRFDERSTRTQSSVRRRGSTIQVVQRFALREGVTWEAAVRSGSQLFVAGYEGHALVLAVLESGTHPNPEYSRWYVPEQHRGRILLTPVAGRHGSVFLHVVGLNESQQDFSLRFSRVGNRVVNLPWADTSVTGIGVGRQGLVWTVNVSDTTARIQGHRESGSPVVARTLPMFPETRSPVTFVQPFEGGCVVCVIEQTLVVSRSPDHASDPPDRFQGSAFDDSDLHMAGESDATMGRMEQFSLPDTATAFCSLEEGRQPRVAVLFAERGLMHWLNSARQEFFAAGLTHPVAVFAANEDLIVTDDGGHVEIYRSRSERLELAVTHRLDAGRPIAILRGDGVPVREAGDFVIVRENGMIDVLTYHAG